MHRELLPLKANVLVTLKAPLFGGGGLVVWVGIAGDGGWGMTGVGKGEEEKGWGSWALRSPKLYHGKQKKLKTFLFKKTYED